MLFVHTLGTALIDAGETRVTPASVRKFAMLLHLSAERGRRVSRGTLQDLVFPDQTDKNAKHSLRELVYQVRQAGVRLASDPHGIEIVPEHVSSDYGEMLGTDALDAERVRAAEGGFLPGYAPQHSEAFTEWLEAYRLRSTSELCKKLLAEVRRARSNAEWAATERAARACLALDSLNEEATLVLAEMLAIGGAKVQAVRLLDRYVEEVGGQTSDLKLPATVLRRRIGERLGNGYVAQGTMPFVGRGSEMSKLKEHFDLVSRGLGQCVVVAGEAGIGKTRLVHEFVNLAILAGARVEIATSQPHDVARPMGAFIDLVPRLLRLPGALGCDPSSIESLTRLTTHSPDHGRDFPTDQEIEVVSLGTSRAIADLIDAIASEAPLVIVVEDAHWLDTLSQETIAALVSSRVSRRVLFVITTREGRQFADAFRHADRSVILPLRGLDEDAAAELARNALGSASTRALDTQIASRSGGNPLFVVTLASHSQSQGSHAALPSTLRELLARRLDGLTPRSLALLQTCISLGRHCTIARLVAALEAPRMELLTMISELSDARLIESSDQDIRSAHPLIADALAERALPAWLKLVNRQVAEVLQEDADRDNSASLLWDCAELWVAAGEKLRALRAYQGCARHAIDIGRPLEAAKILDRASELCDSQHELVTNLRQLILVADLACDRALGARASDQLESLGTLIVHDDVELAMKKTTIARYMMDVNLPRSALTCIDAESASPDHRIRAAIWGLKLADISGDSRFAEEVTGRVRVDDLNLVDREIRLEYQMVFHSAFGEADTCTQAARDLIAYLPQLSMVRRLPLLKNAAVAFWRAGAVADAIAAFRECHDTGESIGAHQMQLESATQVAGMYADVSAQSSADHWIAQAAKLAGEIPGLESSVEFCIMRLDFALHRRDLPAAQSIVAQLTSSELFGHRGLAGRWWTAINLRLRVLQYSLSRNDIEEARKLAAGRGSSMCGITDFEITAACMVLQIGGSPGEALELLRRYGASEPNRRRPVAQGLRFVCEQFGVRLAPEYTLPRL